jgi:hypothetical protein
MFSFFHATFCFDMNTVNQSQSFNFDRRYRFITLGVQAPASLTTGSLLIAFGLKLQLNATLTHPGTNARRITVD